VATKKKAPTAVGSQSATATHPRIDFIKSIKFGGIGLDKSTASVNRTLLSQAGEQEKSLEIELTMNQSVLAHEEDYFVIAANFDLTQRAKGSDKKIVSITGTFSAKFDLTKAASEELVKGFAGLEARLIFFSLLASFRIGYESSNGDQYDCSSYD
jgi:hypothetical protein